MTKFIENWPDGSNRAAFAPPVCDYVEDIVLAADVIRRVPIPAGKRFAVFCFDGDFRMKIGTNVTDLVLPTASTIDGSGSTLNPAARRIPPMLPDNVTPPTHFVLRAPAICRGSIEFYE
ncbi:hypothetical protein [Bosea sp. ASV33]|uniref:hypothetical protein n=1 Tax=Bosea sp. ASV33 TaxID=2795106 RepID=UPI0018ECA661|nr:hypothetical protein [Bosea sp. ASV33]